MLKRYPYFRKPPKNICKQLLDMWFTSNIPLKYLASHRKYLTNLTYLMGFFSKTCSETPGCCSSQVQPSLRKYLKVSLFSNASSDMSRHGAMAGPWVSPMGITQHDMQHPALLLPPCCFAVLIRLLRHQGEMIEMLDEKAIREKTSWSITMRCTYILNGSLIYHDRNEKWGRIMLSMR